MTTPTNQPELLPRSEMLGCSFCGIKPKSKLSKVSYCQLHGEPSQSFIIYCDNHHCPVRPQVAGGDATWKGHETDEKTKAVLLWNTRAPVEPQNAKVKVSENINRAYVDQLTECEAMRREIARIGLGICGYASDTVWIGLGETAIDAIMSLLRIGEDGLDQDDLHRALHEIASNDNGKESVAA